MKKTKRPFILAAIFLVAFCVLAAVFALLSRFSSAETDPPTEADGPVLTPLENETGTEALAWQEAPGGDLAVFETDLGVFKVALFPSEGTELFLSRVGLGLYDNAAFSVLAKDLFAQVPPVNGETASLQKTDLAAVYGALGFVLDRNGRASDSLVIVTAQTLSGLSRAYITENPETFGKERAAFYEEKGGLPDYESRLALFGQVVDGSDVLSAIAEGKTDGYTGGYNAETPVTILSIHIEKAEK